MVFYAHGAGTFAQCQAAGKVQFHDMQELFEHDIQLDSHMSLVDPWTFTSGAP